MIGEIRKRVASALLKNIRAAKVTKPGKSVWKCPKQKNCHNSVNFKNNILLLSSGRLLLNFLAMLLNFLSVINMVYTPLKEAPSLAEAE